MFAKKTKMRLIISPFTDAAINLALEEVYFKSSTEELCFIYRNTPTVVVGKHQNTFREVNLPFCIKNNIGFYRRISGGGTVFHDLGNLNISLHSTRKQEFKVDYEPLLNLITKGVEPFGIDLREGERNDLFLHDKKVTGTACHVVRDRTIHHGTLLLNSDKELIHECLHQALDIKGRGVESVRSKVTNILDQLENITTEEFITRFTIHISEILEAYIDYPTDEEVEFAEKLKQEKYTMDEWNLDYSPPFEVELDIIGQITHFEVEKGHVKNTSPLNKALLNKPFLEILKEFTVYK